MASCQRIDVGTIGAGVFRSAGGGDRFDRAMNGMFVKGHVRALVVHPRDPRILYLGGERKQEHAGTTSTPTGPQ